MFVYIEIPAKCLPKEMMVGIYTDQIIIFGLNSLIGLSHNYVWSDKLRPHDVL